jgi:diguanylate cyclase (GGDEF)-like protein
LFKFKHFFHRVVERPPEERIVLTLCLIGIVALAPFAVMRFARADYIIGFIDLLGAIVAFVMVAYVLRTGKIKIPGLIMSIASVLGVVFVTRMQGNGDVNLLYPAILWSFFMVTPNTALAFGILAMTLTAPFLMDQMDSFVFAKFVASIFACMLFAYTFATLRNRQRDALIMLSTKDGLTGVGNRRALDEKMAESIDAYGRNKTAVCLLILDIDKFKVINDKLGHGMGDHILKSITNIIQARIRATDNLYRYGGDEFVILTTGADMLTAMGLAEDIRAKVESNGLIHDSHVSLSLGVAQYVEGQSAKHWLECADTALLKAKREGRNKVFAALV